MDQLACLKQLSRISVHFLFCLCVWERFCNRVLKCLVRCGLLLYSCEMQAYPIMIREYRVITGAASASSQGHLWLPSLTKAKLPGLPSTFIRSPYQVLSPLCLLLSAPLSSFTVLSLPSLTIIFPPLHSFSSSSSLFSFRFSYPARILLISLNRDHFCQEGCVPGQHLLLSPGLI